MVHVRLTTRNSELIEDMGEWGNVNCYASGQFTLNRWTEFGFRARVIALEKDQVLVIQEGEDGNRNSV